ncbi:YrhK family protein [Reinekea thalattae]|uniref:YrhK domain-containing protein n=1 Tax=Reinekea thalattae TaxID=2593301 RepID=A0A5C8ZBR5_9GAMM|nr:YrhK family protein [Reinekea thalattae]TXR54638.1 hypothetical protein FME95_08900 [Reinekea thalattae]
MKTNSNDLVLDLGQRHIVIQRRYEAFNAFNDLLIAIWFLVGSVMFLSSTLVENGTWLFILGSAQLLIKPLIKLTSLVHVSRAFKSAKDTLSDAG